MTRDKLEAVTLVECPIGLFWKDGTLCLKTEYGNNEGRIDAYIIESGEFFWGDHPQTIANQRRQMVQPIDTDEAIEALSRIQQLEADNAAMRDALEALDARTVFIVKVPAQRGWHRWRKAHFISLEDARVAATKASTAHSRARIVKRQMFSREEVVEQVAALNTGEAK